MPSCKTSFLAENQQKVQKLLSQMAENSDTRSDHFSNKLKIKNTTCSIKIGLILINLGQLNTRKKNVDLEKYLQPEPCQVLYQFYGKLQRVDGNVKYLIY